MLPRAPSSRISGRDESLKLLVRISRFYNNIALAFRIMGYPAKQKVLNRQLEATN
jgi:hypothetical protein